MVLLSAYFTSWALALALALGAYWTSRILLARLTLSLGKRTWRARLTTSQTADFIVLGIAMIAVVGLVTQALHNYDSFNSFRDMYDFDSSLVALLKSGSINAIMNFSRRFNPILIALIPLYALWDDPRILLILQSTGLALTIFPLYWFARKQIGRTLAIGVILVYLTLPALQFINNPVFYEIKLSIPLLSLATFFLLRQRYTPFLVCLGIALLLKQEVAFIALGFAAYIFFIQRKYALGLGLAATGIALAIFVIQVLYPALTQGQPYPQFDERYSYLGHSFGEVLVSLLTRPTVVLEHLATPAKINFVLNLLVPLAFLPLLGLEVLAISLPTWLYTLLSELPQQTDPTQYYQSPLIPFLFFATILGIRRLLSAGKVAHNLQSNSTRTEHWARKLALIVLLGLSVRLYLPGTWTRIFDPAAFQLDEHAILGHQLMEKIPPAATVVVQTELYIPVTAERKYNTIDFAPVFDMRQAEYVFGDATRNYYKIHRNTWDAWRASGYFETVVDQDGYFILRRIPSIDPARQIDQDMTLVGFASAANPFLRPLNFEFGEAITLLGYYPVPSDQVAGNQKLDVVVEWSARQAITTRYIFLAQLVDAQGHIWAQVDGEPVRGFAPTNRWQTGDIIRDKYTFALPSTIPPGTYKIVVGIWDPSMAVSLTATDPQGKSLGIRPMLGSIQVEKDTRSVEGKYLAIDNPIYVDMQEIRLLGSTVIPSMLRSNDELQIGLYWRARKKPSQNYAVQIELRNRGGAVVATQTSEPAYGAYRTTLWQPGEVLLDWHDLRLPAGLAPGTYTLVVVLQNGENQIKLGEATLGEIQLQ
jgi:uncharacterized membrane protein